MGSAILEEVAPPVPLQASLLADYVEFNDYDDGNDEYILDYIDLILFAILTQIERSKQYQQNPTEALLHEISEHSAYISRAEKCLNVHIRRIIQNFKTTINYDVCMSGASVLDTRIIIENETDITH